MRILIHGLNFTPEPVGTGKYTGEMARWLVSRGHQVKVICAPPYYPEWRVAAGYPAWGYRRETLEGVEVLRCPLWVPRKVGAATRLLHLSSFTLSSIIPMLWQRHWRPDVVLAIEPPLAGVLPAWLAGMLTGARTWLHVQDFEIDAAFGLGLLRSEALRRGACRLEAALMRRLDRISTISETMVERAMRKTGGRPPCVLFPNWVDTGQIRPLPGASPYRKELGIGDGQIVLLYSGSMGAKQGLEVVLDAARGLAGDPRVLFVMAGAGPAHERLRAAAADIGNMRWLPLQPARRLNAFLNFADVHLLPQRADAADLVMPSKLTGMLASGRPVIATARAGTQIAQVVRGAGLVVEPGDPGALIQAIMRLADDAALRQSLGAAARGYATEMLERERVLAGFERELTGVLRGELDGIPDTPS